MAALHKASESVHQLRSTSDLDPLMRDIGKARVVLLGEASHGTHEYYAWRTAISKRLIEEKRFQFIAVEGDWPDCYKINRYVKGFSDAGNSAVEVLSKFNRWPTWMWANWEVAALMEWMREYNKSQSLEKKVGFYGLDVYSLRESMHVLLNYLRREDPKMAQLAIEAFRCFEPYKEGNDYARAILNMSPDCTEEAIQLLKTIRRKASNYDHDPEAALNTEVNAKVIVDAEKYYRSMVLLRNESWNIRDSHMVETLEMIMEHHGRKAKAIVWEHNTHVGDARYTDMKEDGMCNVGEMIRDNLGEKECYIVGFGSYEGTVVAASQWDGKMENMNMPPAASGSVEDELHKMSAQDKLLLLRQPHWREKFNKFIGHRAVGVVYHPESESGNYVPSLLPFRYDAFIYFDRSKALHPIDVNEVMTAKMPETYPFGY